MLKYSFKYLNSVLFNTKKDREPEDVREPQTDYKTDRSESLTMEALGRIMCAVLTPSGQGQLWEILA